MSGCSSPWRDVLSIFIGDLTSKSALLLFTLLIAIKPRFKNRPFVGNHIKCSYMINRVLLISLWSLFWGWVIDIYYITIFVELTNERYIFYYFIRNYDDDCTLNLYVSYTPFIIICLANLDPVICWCFFPNFVQAVKEWHNVIF